MVPPDPSGFPAVPQLSRTCRRHSALWIPRTLAAAGEFFFSFGRRVSSGETTKGFGSWFTELNHHRGASVSLWVHQPPERGGCAAPYVQEG